MPRAQERPRPSLAAPAPTERPDPVAPFDAWPIQYVEPSVGYYWYLEPATLICQSYAPHGSFEVIERHNDVVDRVLARHRKAIQGAFATMILKSAIEILTDPTPVVKEAKLTAPPRNQPFI